VAEPPEPQTPPDDSEEKRSTDSLIPEIYDELRKLAGHQLASERAGQTLSATALVHEVYLVLQRDGKPQWANRRHFYVASAQAMRRILIGRARRKNAIRRGGGVAPEPLPDDSIHAPAAPEKPDELIALDDALTKLATQDERKADLVSLRYFVGQTIEEAAQVLGISIATAKRDWSFARAWILEELEEGG
jgi:RNA polymerase sigma factor (TIGR02999 family)